MEWQWDDHYDPQLLIFSCRTGDTIVKTDFILLPGGLLQVSRQYLCSIWFGLGSWKFLNLLNF